MKRIHALTTAGLIFAFTGIALIPSEIGWLVSFYALLAYFFSFKEISKYTSKYQFFIVFLAAFLLGISIDIMWMDIPLSTFACIAAAAGSIGRIVFFRKFGYSQYRWFEPIMFILASSLYLTANLIHSSRWESWIFPGCIIAFQGILSGGAFNDQKQLYKWRKKLEKQFVNSEKDDKKRLFGYTNRGGGIEVGNEAPDFSLHAHDGSTVTLSAYKDKMDVLLIFTRGDWCPGCHMMLKAYADGYKNILDKNILLLAIGPDSEGVNDEMTLKLGIKFKILADVDQQTAVKYGVQLAEYDNIFASRYKEGITVPSLFLIDKNGLIRYASRNDKVGVFLSPETVLPILDKLN